MYIAMSSRMIFSIVFLLLSIALFVCAMISRKSARSIAKNVRVFLLSIIPPTIGSIVMALAVTPTAAIVGHYIYSFGLDFCVYALLAFTIKYSKVTWPGRQTRFIILMILDADMAQLIVGLFTGHVFTIKENIDNGIVYYALRTNAGLGIHMIVIYGTILLCLSILIYKVAHSPRIYIERYLVFLVLMAADIVWTSIEILTKSQVDSSMIGIAAFGLLAFYFALYYRPMRLLDRILADVSSHSEEAIFFFDASMRCVWANSKGVDMIDAEENEYEKATEKIEERFGKIDYTNVNSWCMMVPGEAGAGGNFYTLSNHFVTDSKGRFSGILLSIKDTTDEEKALRQAQHDARHDPLTDLYSQKYLFEKIHEQVVMAEPGTYMCLLINITDFKIINDVFGKLFGDYALQCIANVFRENLSENTIYGRIFGDKFGICMPLSEFDEEETGKLCSRFVIEKGTVTQTVLAHGGIYVVNEPELDVSVMFDRANMALSTIKYDYNTHIAYYSDELREMTLWNQQLLNDIPDAIESGQIRPFLQPIVDDEGKVIGAEALVRWSHPNYGMLSPAKFIPIIEESGLIVDVDKYMWHCACKILERWKKEGKDLFISINISPKDFYFIDVANEIRSIVKEYDIDPGKLRIELTETVMMADIENRVKIIDGLRKDGFMVEMDDFGSGYSSLNMLKDITVDVVKIDMMFLRETHHNEKTKEILNSIIELVDKLEIVSLTEGVETEQQYNMLKDMGCKMYQGYYFSKPVEVEEFEKKLAEAS